MAQPRAREDSLEVGMSRRVNVATVIIRADRRWCMDNAAEATLPDHLNAIIQAVEAQVGIGAVDQLRVDLANTAVLLGKLVAAVTRVPQLVGIRGPADQRLCW